MGAAFLWATLKWRLFPLTLTGKGDIIKENRFAAAFCRLLQKEKVMLEWWNGLELFLKVLYCIAIPATVVLILQTIFMIIGLGDGGDGDISGVDADAGGDFDTGDGHLIPADSNAGDFNVLQLFTLQGAVAFLCVLGWSSIIARVNGLHMALCVVIGLALGLAAMFVVSKVIRLSAKLASNGAIDYDNAVGLNATVYIKIPAGGKEHGKVTLAIQGRLAEADAITLGDEDIPTGAAVKIMQAKDDTLVCIPAEKPNEIQAN